MAENNPEDLLAWGRANPPVDDAKWKGVGMLTCRPAIKNVCGNKGCQSAKPAVWLRLRPEDGHYERCDSKGCDSYKTEVYHSGSWTTMVAPDRAMMARVAYGGDYVESVAQWDALYISHGKCSRGGGGAGE